MRDKVVCPYNISKDVFLWKLYIYLEQQIKSQEALNLLGKSLVSLMSIFLLSEEISFNPFTKFFDI